MTDWISGSESIAVADKSLHAGITVDLMRNNLLKAGVESGFDISSYPFDGDSYISQTATGINVFLTFSALNPILIPLRRDITDTLFREIQIDLRGKCSAAGTITVKAYVLKKFNEIENDGVNGYPGITEYGEYSFTSTSYAWKSDSFIPSEAATITDSSGTYSAHVGYLILLFKVSASMTFTLQGLRVKELPA